MAIAMRYVKAQVPDFEALGLPSVLKTVAEAPRGIVLLAGPTGSGKSTSLAAMIEHVNANFRKHIVTMEDPIEYVFEDNQSVIEQREVGLDTETFYTGLRASLRQDPDLIMIGEMRDATTFLDFGSVNVGYADVDGNIAAFAAGEQPLREDLQTLERADGAPPFLIRDGSGARKHEWLPASTRFNTEAPISAATRPCSSSSVPYAFLISPRISFVVSTPKSAV
jgi:energy-coupling factor transporter ATP-binding protein EcfA2